MSISLDSVGRFVWGLSCLLAACFLLIYDGAIKRNISVLSGLFVIFLILQTFVSCTFIVMSYFNLWIISYISCALSSLSATIHLIMSNIIILSPLHENRLMKIIIFLVLPIIYLSFLIGLFFMTSDQQMSASYVYYIPCGIITYLAMMILYHWHNKEKFVFAVYVHSYLNLPQPQNVHKVANWNLLFKIAFIGMTVVIVANLVYPMFVFYGIIPHHNHGFVVRIIDSLIFLPSIIPLIRNLDKLVEYSKYRIAQYQIVDNNLNEQLQSDPSDVDDEY